VGAVAGGNLAVGDFNMGAVTGGNLAAGDCTQGDGALANSDWAVCTFAAGAVAGGNLQWVLLPREHWPMVSWQWTLLAIEMEPRLLAT